MEKVSDWPCRFLAEAQDVMMGTRVQCRVVQSKRFQSSSRERQCGQADGRKNISDPWGVENNGCPQDRVALVHKNHVWVIGDRTGSRCTAQDFQKFVEAERETQEKLQMPFHDGK